MIFGIDPLKYLCSLKNTFNFTQRVIYFSITRSSKYFEVIGLVHVKLNKKNKLKRIESQRQIFCLLTLYEYVFGNILPKETAINWQKKDTIW